MSQEMRFVFLTLGYHPDLDGGGYRYATEVAERLAGRGHEVHAVFPNPRNSLPAREVRRGVELHRVPDGTGSFFANWRSENAAARSVLEQLLPLGHAPTLLATHQAYFEAAARGAGFLVWAAVAGLIVLIVFRIFSSYLGAIQNAASGL